MHYYHYFIFFSIARSKSQGQLEHNLILHAGRSKLKRVPAHIVYDSINAVDRYFNYNCSAFITLVVLPGKALTRAVTSVHFFNTFELKQGSTFASTFASKINRELIRRRKSGTKIIYDAVSFLCNYMRTELAIAGVVMYRPDDEVITPRYR